MTKKLRNSLIAALCVPALVCGTLGAITAAEPMGAKAELVTKTLLSTDFESGTVSPWSGNGWSDLSIAEGGYNSDYSMRLTRADGQSRSGAIVSFTVGSGENMLPLGSWIEIDYAVKGDTTGTLPLMFQMNHDGTSTDISLALTDFALTTEWQELSAKIMFTLDNGTLHVEWSRVDMGGSTTSGDWQGVTEITAIYLYPFSDNVATYYIDNFTITTQVEEETKPSPQPPQPQGETKTYQRNVLDTDFENGVVDPWDGNNWATLSVIEDGHNGGHAMHVSRGETSSRTGALATFGVGAGENMLPLGEWIQIDYAAKGDAAGYLPFMFQINHGGVDTGISLALPEFPLTTEWQELSAKILFTYDSGTQTLHVEWSRVDMGGTTTSQDWSNIVSPPDTILLYPYSDNATGFVLDDFTVSVPLKVSKAAADVVDLIADIDLDNINADSVTAIEEAYAAYNKLSPELQAEVFNFEDLNTAYRRYLLLDGAPAGEFNDEDVVFRFGAISDTHNNNVETALGILKNWGGEGMDLLVHAGDITDRVEYEGTDSSNPDPYNEIPKAKKLFEDGLDDSVDFFFALGNHDSSKGSHAKDFYDGFGGADGRFYRGELNENVRTTGNRHIKKEVEGHTYHFLAVEASYAPEGIPESSKQFLINTLNEIVTDPAYQNEFIFVVCHVSPPNTVADAGPASYGDLNTILKNYPQVVLLTGHSHTSIYSELAIMQTDFTTVALGSVGYSAFAGKTYLESTHDDLIADKDEEGNEITSYDLPVGTMMELDRDGNLRITRIDFRKNAEIGEPWIISKPAASKAHLLSYTAERKTTLAEAPAWEGDAEGSAVYTSENSMTVTFDTAKDDFYVHSYILELYEADASAPFKTVETLSQFYLYPQASDMPATKAVTLTGLTKLPATIKIFATDSVSKRSAALTLTAEKAANTAEVPVTALRIDPAARTYAADAMYEVAADASFTQILPQSGSLADYIGAKLYIREKENAFRKASAATEVEIAVFAVTFPESDKFEIHKSSANETFFTGEKLEFAIELKGDYKWHGYTVKVDGTAIEPDSDGIYSIVVAKASAVTVELTDPVACTVGFRTHENVTFQAVTEGKSVAKGTEYRFKLSFDEGCDISGLTVVANGKILHADASGVYSTVIEADTEISVSGVKAPAKAPSTGGTETPAPAAKQPVGLLVTLGILAAAIVAAGAVSVIVLRKKH